MLRANKKYRNYTQASLLECIGKIQSGEISVKGGSRQYNIPKTTLLDKISGRCPIFTTQGPSPVLNQAEEEQLVNWLFHMSCTGYGQTRRELCLTVKKILDDDGWENPFNNNLPGGKWVRAFLRRHPEVSERTGEALGVERAFLTVGKIEKWFNEFKKYMCNKKEVKDGEDLLQDPQCIFNCDESGFPLAGKTEKVLAPTGVKYVYQYSNSDRRQITVMACMNAAGLFIKPMLIFPNARFRYDPLEGAPDTFCVGRSSNGWINSEVFFERVANHFLPTVKKEGITLPVLLLLDGHASHISLQTATFCAENSIILYCLPAHSSHILQPCDISLFGSLKQSWRAEVSKWKTNHIGQVVTKQNFASVFAPVWRKCARTDIAVSGFEAAGLYPLNKNWFDQEKLAPSQIYQQPSANTSTASTTSERTSQASDAQHPPTITNLAPMGTNSDVRPPSTSTSVYEAQTTLKCLEATFTAEKKWNYLRRYNEGFDVQTDELYNSWKKIKDQTLEESSMADDNHDLPTTSRSSGDAFANHLRYPRGPDRPLNRKRKGEDLPHVVSGRKFREYLEKKKKEKEEEEARKKINREKREAAKKKKEKEAEKKKKKQDYDEAMSDSDDGGSDMEVDENTCAECQQEYDGNVDDWLGCEVCPRWYHKGCTDILNVHELPDSELRELDWQCQKCL